MGTATATPKGSSYHRRSSTVFGGGNNLLTLPHLQTPPPPPARQRQMHSNHNRNQLQTKPGRNTIKETVEPVVFTEDSFQPIPSHHFRALSFEDQEELGEKLGTLMNLPLDHHGSCRDFGGNNVDNRVAHSTFNGDCGIKTDSSNSDETMGSTTSPGVSKASRKRRNVLGGFFLYSSESSFSFDDDDDDDMSTYFKTFGPQSSEDATNMMYSDDDEFVDDENRIEHQHRRGYDEGSYVYYNNQRVNMLMVHSEDSRRRRDHYSSDDEEYIQESLDDGYDGGDDTDRREDTIHASPSYVENNGINNGSNCRVTNGQETLLARMYKMVGWNRQPSTPTTNNGNSGAARSSRDSNRSNSFPMVTLVDQNDYRLCLNDNSNVHSNDSNIGNSNTRSRSNITATTDSIEVVDLTESPPGTPPRRPSTTAAFGFTTPPTGIQDITITTTNSIVDSASALNTTSTTEGSTQSESNSGNASSSSDDNDGEFTIPSIFGCACSPAFE